MTELNNLEYYRARAAAARELAAAAANPAIKNIHLEMVRRYDRLVEAARGGRTLRIVGGNVAGSLGFR